MVKKQLNIQFLLSINPENRKKEKLKNNWLSQQKILK